MPRLYGIASHTLVTVASSRYDVRCKLNTHFCAERQQLYVKLQTTTGSFEQITILVHKWYISAI